MSKSSILEILKKARETLSEPDSWGKGVVWDRSNKNSYCAAQAIGESLSPDFVLYHKACQVFAVSIPLTEFDAIPDWNDAPERTHAEVLAAFDRAIASLESQTP